MDTNSLLIAMVGFSSVFLVVIVIVFFSMRKKTSAQAELRKSLQKAGSKSSLSSSAFYQKVYLSLATTPIIKRYLFRIRMRFELVGNDDEFHVRAAAGQACLKAIAITGIAGSVLMYINRDSLFMMLVSLIGVLVVVESFTEMGVNKIEDKLLNQQLDLFSEIRHAYHETNMVEEAIYDASLLEENEVNFQADKIYNIMISPNPEDELEKYYDVAPNRFLKQFAGVSYLTKEFGDRKVDGVSLYLKNMNNITQELQMEILKRQKIDYYFNSLSFITLAPIVFIVPIKNWGEQNFASTVNFYEGAGGYAFQIALLIIIFLCFALLKKVKDNGDDSRFAIHSDNPWQEKLYRLPIFGRFIDNLTPSAGTLKFDKLKRNIKASATKKKMEWIYVERCTYCVVAFVCMLLLYNQLHNIAIQNILSQSGKEESVMGGMSDKDKAEAEGMSAADKFVISKISKDKELINLLANGDESESKDSLKAKMEEIHSELQTDEEIEIDANRIFNQYYKKIGNGAKNRAALQQAIFDAHIVYTREDYTTTLVKNTFDSANSRHGDYLVVDDVITGLHNMNSLNYTDEQLDTVVERVYKKISAVSNEYIKWQDVLVSFIVGLIAYNVPIFIIKFQVKMRAMDMENEVMQFQTIILMLMHIERVSVEYMIEWLERFSNIFKESFSTCMNNFESGAYEALEQLKDDVQYKPLIRIVESLQSAVENVKITDAFDELESERAFFQEKRKEANERLINKKSKIGRVVGFAPMVILFVGYLIGPLIVVSMNDMSSYFGQMAEML